MIVWRTVSLDWTYDHLGGHGAAAFPGRWNQRGERTIYTAGSLSLAMLETLIYLQPPYPTRLLLEMEVPDNRIHSDTNLFNSPDIVRDKRRSRPYGSGWLREQKHLAIRVPSVLFPDKYSAAEHNLLINPEHPDIRQVTIRSTGEWNPDQRFQR